MTDVVFQCVFHGNTWGNDGSCVACDAEMAKNRTTNDIAKAIGYGTWTSGYLMSDVGTSDDMVITYVNRALGSGELRCTQPTRTPASILQEAIQRAESLLPHGIKVRCERKVAWRSYMVTACCPHCGADEEVADFSEPVVDELSPEQLAEVIDRNTRVRIPKCISATCCDPLDRYVDGQRVRELLAWYQRWLHAGDVHTVASWKTIATLPQQDAVRLAWSASLRAKQREAREKERVQVCVDDDRWEP